MPTDNEIVANLIINNTFDDEGIYQTKLKQWEEKKGDYSRFEFSGDKSYPIFVFGWDWNFNNACKEVANMYDDNNKVIHRNTRNESKYGGMVSYSFIKDGTDGTKGHAYSKVYFEKGDNDEGYTYNRDEYKAVEVFTNESINNNSLLKFMLYNGVNDKDGSGNSVGRSGFYQKNMICKKPEGTIAQEKKDYENAKPRLNTKALCSDIKNIANTTCVDWYKTNDGIVVNTAMMKNYCDVSTNINSASCKTWCDDSNFAATRKSTCDASKATYCSNYTNIGSDLCTNWCTDSANKDKCGTSKAAYCGVRDMIGTDLCKNWYTDNSISKSTYNTAMGTYCGKTENILTDTCKTWCNDSANKESTCDSTMSSYCIANPNAAICGCMAMDTATKKVITDNKLIHKCHLTKCINSKAYKTAIMNKNTQSCAAADVCNDSITVLTKNNFDSNYISFFNTSDDICKEQEVKKQNELLNPTVVEEIIKQPTAEEKAATADKLAAEKAAEKAAADKLAQEVKAPEVKEDDGEDTKENKILGMESTLFYVLSGVSVCCCCIILMIIIFVMTQ
ncbi:hypothetical protein CCP3SC1AL1_1990002 [Gammaproteobacteria bacterium]